MTLARSILPPLPENLPTRARAKGRPSCVPSPVIADPPPKRIVVISNITRGFDPAPILRTGDLVIHLNHARHAAATIFKPGTRHILFLRHNTASGPRLTWFHSGPLQGFEKLIPINDTEFLPRFRWWSAWRARSAKSPTTGFIAANCARELYPATPLLLAGFDPGRDHGTGRWQGHDWQAEADWYRARGFATLPPAARPAVHQIWLGSPIPEREGAWVENIRAAATAAGWSHTLWDLPGLTARFAADPLLPMLTSLLTSPLANPAIYAIASDYFRLALLAEPYPAGSLYLDTDFYCPGDWPELPTADALYVMSERQDPQKPANGAFYLPPLHDETPFVLARDTLRRRLQHLCPTPAAALQYLSRRRVPYISGPVFLRRRVYPFWGAYTILPQSLLTHTPPSLPPPPLHLSAHSWHIPKIC